jgi:hypothetical protein
MIVYLCPPLMVAAVLLVIVSWLGDKQPAWPDAATEVRKGGRIGSQSEMFR